jgi:hypothetical protein
VRQYDSEDSERPESVRRREPELSSAGLGFTAGGNLNLKPRRRLSYRLSDADMLVLRAPTSDHTAAGVRIPPGPDASKLELKSLPPALDRHVSVQRFSARRRPTAAAMFSGHGDHGVPRTGITA